jgi:beta-lactam-binding protein with PASTA domain
VAPGPTLVAVPPDPRQGELVELTGSGWGGGSTPEGPGDGGVDLLLQRGDLRAAAPDPCQVTWTGPGGTPSCSLDGDGGLTGTLAVPADAEPASYQVTACSPDCAGPEQQATTTVAVRPSPTTVPDLAGQTVDEARTSVLAQGLRLDLALGSADDPTATVTAQTPEPGTEVERDSVVTVTLSAATGPSPTEGVLVPDLSGLPRAAAARALDARDLQLAVDPGGDDAGRVRSQRPAPGSVVDPGTVVTVTLLAPGGRVVVPDVVGLDRAQAQASIDAAGLIMRADADGDGRVRTQTPAAGTLVPAGSVVGVGLGATGTPGWVVLAVVAAVAGLVGGLLRTALDRRRRRPRWVREHVQLRARPAAARVEVHPAGPSHSVRLVPAARDAEVEVEEVLR